MKTIALIVTLMTTWVKTMKIVNQQACMFTVAERELIKFLSLVEQGEGMRTAKAEDFLSYIKTFQDERAQLLPKKMKTCWRRVDKVPFHCHYCRDSCLLLYIPLVNYISMQILHQHIIIFVVWELNKRSDARSLVWRNEMAHCYVQCSDKRTSANVESRTLHHI